MTSLAEAIGGTKRVIGGPFGSKLTQRDYVEIGVPVIRGGNMQHAGRWIGGDFAYVSEDKYQRDLKSNTARPGDIIVTQRGTLGQVSIVPENGMHSDYVVSQSQMAVRVDEREASRDFVYYFLTSPIFDDYVEKATIQTGVPHINLGILRDVQVEWPDVQTQIAIARVLASLDDKIELNRRMNETLEEMALALFRDWFVDFGPTRRQMEGATDPAAIMGHAFPPEKAAALAPLFPARLGDDGLPEGWTRSDVGTEFDVVMGQSPPGYTYNETGEGLPFFQGRRDFGFRFPSRRVYCAEPKREAERDWTLLSVRAPVGDINRAVEKCAIGRGVGAFLHKAGLHSFTYYSGLALRSELESYDKDGTVFGSINQKQFKGLQVVVPEDSLTVYFDEIAKPLDGKIRLNTEENQTLAEMRDLLLPKLMSGEIRLKDTGAAV